MRIVKKSDRLEINNQMKDFLTVLDEPVESLKNFLFYNNNGKFPSMTFVLKNRWAL